VGRQSIAIRTVFDRDTVLHLRIPFSFFLAPVFCFGVSQADGISAANVFISFIALHIFIYPGSNSYNSYMDKDTGSIGGLEKPPPATSKLYYASIIFDMAGLLLMAAAAWQLCLLTAVYVAFSKAYSWHGIRLKKHTYLSWLTVMFFQGGYTFMIAHMAASSSYNADWFTAKNLEGMLISSLIIGGSYPLTQIYQHAEDTGRGDKTLSSRLGIPGTFIFTTVFFSAGAATALHYFKTYYAISHFLIFAGCLLPVAAYFSNWFIITKRDNSNADYRHVMVMNKVSSLCMTICFVTLFYLNHR